MGGPTTQGITLSPDICPPPGCRPGGELLEAAHRGGDARIPQVENLLQEAGQWDWQGQSVRLGLRRALEGIPWSHPNLYPRSTPLSLSMIATGSPQGQFLWVVGRGGVWGGMWVEEAWLSGEKGFRVQFCVPAAP